MARLKKVFSHYDQANTRLSALKSIDPALDLGSGLTVQHYETQVMALRNKLNAYNTMLSAVDQLSNEANALETALQDLSERMLLGVATKFGKNSNEYEMAGGTKKSERKKPVRKPQA
jgi:uncharacterized protein YukE